MKKLTLLFGLITSVCLAQIRSVTTSGGTASYLPYWVSGTVVGNTNITYSGSVLIVPSLRLTTSPVSGYVLTSDASGNASWAASGISGLTTDFLTRATSSSTIGNAALKQQGRNIGLSSGYYLSGSDSNQIRMYFGTSGSPVGILSADGGSGTYGGQFYWSKAYCQQGAINKLATHATDFFTDTLGNAEVFASDSLFLSSNKGVSIQAARLLIDIPSKGAAKVLTSDASGYASWAASGWGLTGNAGTVDGTHFIGTTDNIPLNFRVNNTTAGRIDNTKNNTFFGFNSGAAITTGTKNVCIGESAGLTLSTTGNNVFVGYEAGKVNASSSNVFVGFQAGVANNNTGNVFVGNLSGTSSTNSSNTYVGAAAGRFNTTGNDNAYFGFGAGAGPAGGTTASNNTYIGSKAGQAATGSKNTIVGWGAKQATAGIAIVTGDDNIIMGYQTSYVAGGDKNVIIGSLAHQGGGNSSNNVLIGYGAAGGIINLSGGNNIFLGYQSGLTPSTGNSITLIGALTDASATITNATAIGANASVTASNSIVLGSAANVGIGTTAPANILDVIGGHIGIGTIGKTLKIHKGSSGDMFGDATLVAGTLAVTITGLATTDRAFCQLTVTGGTLGTHYKAVCTANTLTITAVDTGGATVTTDTSTLTYHIIRPY